MADLRINGVSVGEGGMNGLYAGWFGVPVAAVSGDSLTIEELEALIPGVEGVVVKAGIWERAVRTLTPDSARAAIRRGVQRGLRQLPGPMDRADSYTVELEYLSNLPTLPIADDGEVLALVEGRQLMGSGIGWADAYLLASSLLARVPLWTLDKPLARLARRLGVSAA
ncbi:MAG: M55 family metallopeptidase [Gemmatimonadales bacterium]